MILGQTWRWFGPEDRVTLRDAHEAGATGIVTALHEIPAGEIWPVEAIRARQEMVRAAELEWTVVESLDVTERIKIRAPGWKQDVENFLQSVRHLAGCGIRTIAYNCMPLFSWTRRHLREPAPMGGYTTRFDALAFAAFDVYILKRTGAEEEWGEGASRAAFQYFKDLFPAQVCTASHRILPLPDHGQELLYDRDQGAAPGYPAVGRLRGLAELRGAFMMARKIDDGKLSRDEFVE